MLRLCQGSCSASCVARHAAAWCVIILQGMNFLVGLLLVAVERDCVRCFWLLLVLLEQVGHSSLACMAHCARLKG